MSAGSVTLARAIIEIGTTGVTDAEAQLRALEADLRDVGRQYAAGTIQTDDYLKANQRLHGEINSLRGGIETAEAALKKYGSAQAAAAALSKQVDGNTRQLGQGFLELSRAFEDAQYGLRGVLNNIPTTIQMFGGPAGLAAGVSAAAVAFSIFQPKITEFLTSMGLFDDATKKAATGIKALEERISELEAKPVKLAVDTVELDNAKRKLKDLQNAQQAFDQFKGTRSEEDRQVGDQVEQLIAMAPGGASGLADKLRQSMGNQLLGSDQAYGDIQKKLTDARARAERGRKGELAPASFRENARRAAEAEREAKKLEDESDKRRLELLGDEVSGTKGEAHTKVGELFRGATSGDDAARRKLVGQLNKIGQKTLAQEIEATNRRGVEIAKEEERQEKREESKRQTNEFIRGLEAKRKKLAEAEQKKLDEAEAEKAKPVISAFVKGSGLAGRATKILGDLESGKIPGDDGKPMGGQQQLEFLQEQIKEVIVEELKSRGLLNPGSNKAAAATATQLAGQAKTDLDRSTGKAQTDMERDLAKQTAHAASVFGPKIDDELKEAALARVARGQQDGVIQQALMRQVAERLRANGVNDNRVAGGAAEKIVEGVVGGMRLDLQTEGPDVRATAGRRLDDLRRKRAGKEDREGRDRQVDALAGNIQDNSFQELGVQFTAEQSKAAAKATADMVGKGVSYQAALQSALAEQLGAMNAMGNQIMQQQGMLQRFAQEFAMVRRGIATRQRTAAKRN